MSEQKQEADASGLAVPLYIWVDPTNSCNLACAYCYTKHSHGQVHMSPETFERVLDWLEPVRASIKVLHLNWRGEPLMNPKFEELLIAYGRRWQQTPMHWHTNGVLLTRKRAARIVAAAMPHRAFVSIDGGTAESHEGNRGAGTFRQSLAGLRNLLEANGSDGPLTVGLYQIDLGIPSASYDSEFADLASRAGEWIRLKPLELDGCEGATAQPHDRSCFWAGHALCIDPLGEVSVCLLSKGKRGSLGNVSVDSVTEVIGRSVAWRHTLDEAGRAAKAHCAGCRKKNGGPVSDVSLVPFA